jgi:low affinity Fe/Cu permease
MIMKTPMHDADSLAQAKKTVAERPASPARAIREIFHRFSQAVSSVAGSPWTFFAAALIVIIWAGLGRHYHYSDTWQLIINTGTTIVTFLMVFLIQNTQNRDAKAIHLKLDELIRSKRGARNALMDLQNCTEEELDEIEGEFKRLRDRAARHPEHADDVAHVKPAAPSSASSSSSSSSSSSTSPAARTVPAESR